MIRSMKNLYLKVDHHNRQVTQLLNADSDPEEVICMTDYNHILEKKRIWDDQRNFQIENQNFTLELLPIDKQADLYVLSLAESALSDEAKTLEAFTLAGKVFDHCESENELCFHTVKFAKDILSIDRAGLLLYSPDQERIVGTWGTDVDGNIVNESDLSLPLNDNPWMKEALLKKGVLIIKENVDLLDYGKSVGKGWNAIVSIYYGNEPLGWFCCDNLVHHRPIDPWLRLQIGHFATLVGQWLIRRKNEDKLRLLNQSLERQIKEKTAELQNTIQALTHTQADLINTERSKALASFTAGIAHEINNPIGFIRSNLSFIGKVSSRILAALSQEDSVQKRQSLDMLNEIDAVIDESVEGLDRVSNIISMLQPLNKLADEVPQAFNLQNAIEFAVMGIDNEHVQIRFNNPMKDLEVMLPLQIFTLAIENVLENSLSAVKSTESAAIEVNIECTDTALIVSVQDNGHGIKPEDIDQIFTPFFTTKAPGDGLGLGLSLSNNLIQLAGGRMKATSVFGQGTLMTISFDNGVIVHG